MALKLVSFADAAFRSRQVTFRHAAERFGGFDDIRIYDAQSLPLPWKENHLSFMQQNPRGFGYWIWKPVVILDALLACREGDTLVYLDAGYSLNSDGIDRFHEYVELAGDSEFRMLSFQNAVTEAYFSKADLAARLGLSLKSSEMKTSQLTANIMLMQRTKANVDLLQDWITISVEDNYRYSDDSPSKLANHARFSEHRHDQSIASLLRKLRGTEVTHMETQSHTAYHEMIRDSLPALCTRLRT